MKDVIKKHALLNAQKFGKTKPSNLIGKVLSELPEFKNKVKDLLPEIEKVVKEVNSLSPDTIEKEASKYEVKKKIRRTGLKELKNVKKKVIMRFAPSPSGPMHIGHAYALNLSSEYVRKYGGELILRIEDTNPENIDPIAYEVMPKEADWITMNNITKVWIQSDRLETYYKYAQRLFDLGALYVCICDDEHARKLRNSKIACPCRSQSKEDNKIRWKKMLDGHYKMGEAVVRVKTDIEHKNPAMRDFPVFRINTKPHPKKKNRYRVWPLMNFSVFVDDVEAKMTHIIRGKDHADNAKRQEYLYNYLDKPIPETVFVGRINFEGMPVSCSKVKELIRKGDISGWDDIRLPFITPLKNRGYQPQALIKYATQVGTSQNDKTVTKDEFFKTIDHLNKEIIEPISHRYFFIQDPIKIKIKNAPELNIELHHHPDHKKGGRKFKTDDEFYITKTDFDSLADVNRLMDCLNFSKNMDFIDTDYMTYKKSNGRIIHWLTRDHVDVEILMPDGCVRKGIAESGVRKLKVGDIIQFERFGFCRLNSIKGTPRFWYTHS